jgi:hypothetical protein
MKGVSNGEEIYEMKYMRQVSPAQAFLRGIRGIFTGRRFLCGYGNMRGTHQGVCCKSRHSIARPRPIFSTFPLRCMSLSWSVTRRTKSVRVERSASGSSPLSRIASLATSRLVTVPRTAARRRCASSFRRERSKAISSGADAVRGALRL